MAETSSFPPDLWQAQRDFYAITNQLAEIPPPPYTTADGTEHRTNKGWTPQLQEKAETLRARLRELAEVLTTHPYWAEFAGPAVPQARMRLKQEALQDQPDTGA